MLFAARRRGALLIMPRPLSGCQIKAETKGFLLVYRLFQCKHWFYPNFEVKDFPELTFTPCIFLLFFTVSYPRGDTELLVGSEAIDIFCHLNPNYKPYWGKGLRSSHLSFHLRPKDGSEWAELESQIINETTIAAKYNPDRVAKGKK